MILYIQQSIIQSGYIHIKITTWKCCLLHFGQFFETRCVIWYSLSIIAWGNRHHWFLCYNVIFLSRTGYCGPYGCVDAIDAPCGAGFWKAAYKLEEIPLIARFLGPTWGPPGADRTQVGPILAPWISLSGTWRVQVLRISRIRGYGFVLFHFDHMFSFGYKKEDIRSSLILTSMEKFGLAHITFNYTSEMTH